MSHEKDAVGLEHVETPDPVSATDGEIIKHIEARAKEAVEAEHALTPYQAIKAYPMAVFWSFMVCMCVIMEGYDTFLISNFYAYPSFAKKYGQYVDSKGQPQLSAPWQSGLGNAAGIGSFFGVMINGWLVDRFGQKPVILGSLATLSCFVFLTFFAPSIGVLTTGEFLCGIPWGIFASSAPAYSSEVLPLSLRTYMTSYTNMCFIIGQLIAAGILYGLVGSESEWSYRIPFAVQWAWPAFLIPILFFAPESPWYLVRKGRLEEAEKSLRRLQSKRANIDAKDTLATIIHTNQLEVELTAGTSYWDCIRGTELRRTEIACMTFAGQVFCGINFASNSTYFFQQVGLSTSVTYKLNMGGPAIAIVGCLTTWFIVMPYCGRRTAYVYGMLWMACLLFILGILNVWTKHPSVGMAQACLMLVWGFSYQLSAGMFGWSIPAEIGSTRLRQKTVCVARNTYYVTSVAGTVLQSYFMNPDYWNAKGYVGFFWGGIAFLTFVWAFFRLPETKGRTFEEIDWLFAKRTPTWKFRTAEIDIFDQEERKRL